jgi:hypothetical protein
VADLRHSTVLEDFARLPPDGQAAFAHTWVAATAERLEETWPMFYRLLKVVEDHEVYKHAVILGHGKDRGVSYASFAEYFEAIVKRPFLEWGELEQTYARYARGDVTREQGAEELSVGRRAAQRTAKEDQLPHGGDHTTEEARAKFALASRHQRAAHNDISHETQRKLDRLARDFPDLHDQVKRGKLSTGLSEGIAETLWAFFATGHGGISFRGQLVGVPRRWWPSRPALWQRSRDARV